MRRYICQRDITYIVQDGYLVRTVTGSETDARAYTHRCTRKTYETVAHAIEESPAECDGTSGEHIARHEELPFTQVNVALEFLKERGVVDVRHRRSYPATQDAYLDAMIEFHALEEKSRPDGGK